MNCSHSMTDADLDAIEQRAEARMFYDEFSHGEDGHQAALVAIRSADDVPDLVTEIRRLRAATLADMIDPIEQAFSDARDHAECAVTCELCGERLADRTCDKCHGAGCLPNIALAYLECDECGGVGRIHDGCMEMSYDDLGAEVRRLRAMEDRVRELHQRETYQIWDHSSSVEVAEACCTECVDDEGRLIGWPCPTISALDGSELP